ncbi:GntR family transcriptional regulator [Extibacter muris]|uniref:GntR family transcriptional regulator n=1 Tax=Extibacter muris TaxID=1796622 RepID=A0A4R4FH47_9FIRM|nr:GntR family transcriptional regulator [Extibacter muris]MCU0078587.1 GntR family transcriptional regulator [Extibacter muris]TDA22861.1 GntR family transcriptional regulator [Extibacter muris]
MNTSKYLEIAELIRMDIFVKYTKANQLIPSIRSYAKIYNVNPNTVSRAFHLLEADNIIYSCRTRGYYVSENIQEKKEECGKKYAKHLLSALQRLGYSDTEIENMIEEIIKR